MDVVSWFPVVLQQLWIDVSVRRPHAENTLTSRGNQEWLWGNGKMRRHSDVVLLRARWLLGGEGIKLLRDLVTTAAAHTLLEDPAGTGGDVCSCRTLPTSAWDEFVQWALLSDLLLLLICCRQSRALTLPTEVLSLDSHAKFRLTEKETETRTASGLRSCSAGGFDRI